MSKYHKKVLRKQGECIFGNGKPVSFWGTSQLVLALHTQLSFATSAIYAKRNLGPPLNQILDPLLRGTVVIKNISNRRSPMS